MCDKNGILQCFIITDDADYLQYKNICDNFIIADHRLDYLPLMSPYSVALLVGGYLYFVLSFGPKFMSKRKPFNIDKLLVYYNILQVILNFALFAAVSQTLSFKQCLTGWWPGSRQGLSNIKSKTRRLFESVY